jgi:hypothetical protein
MGTQYSSPHNESPHTQAQGSSDSRSPTKRKRTYSTEDNWDFFVPLDEQHSAAPPSAYGASSGGPLSWASPETHPPVYILEGSLSEQELWHATAGQRPVQPADERRHYEELYKNNFEQSEALRGDRNIFDDSAIEKACRMRRETAEEVLFRGKGPFSYAVSKSFLHCAPPAMTLQVSHASLLCGLPCIFVFDCLLNSFFVNLSLSTL